MSNFLDAVTALFAKLRASIKKKPKYKVCTKESSAPSVPEFKPTPAGLQFHKNDGSAHAQVGFASLFFAHLT